MTEKAPIILEDWEYHGQTKIALKCASEEEMLTLQNTARELGICANSIKDAGRTQIAAGSRTVLAIGPGNSILDHTRSALTIIDS